MYQADPGTSFMSFTVNTFRQCDTLFLQHEQVSGTRLKAETEVVLTTSSKPLALN